MYGRKYRHLRLVQCRGIKAPKTLATFRVHDGVALDQSLVNAANNTIKEIETGRILSIAIICTYNDGTVGQCLAGSLDKTAFTMTGAAYDLLHRLHKEIEQ